jgi:hypothetical protein
LVAFCGSHKSKDEKDLDEAEHKEILESILPSSSTSNLRSMFFADTLDLEVVTKVNVYAHVIIQTHNHMSIINIHFGNYF